MRELFMGRLQPDRLKSISFAQSERAEFRAFFDRFRAFLQDHVDPVAIDETGEYPSAVVDGLRKLGAFGLKIPREYGGLGFNHVEYVAIMQLAGSHDANITALLSAHQAIGLPQPLLMFGTATQRETFLPRCAAGSISAFALTEPAVGSDPARLESEAAVSPDGDAFILNGDKLWCTNGTLAELLVVMARDPQTDRINAFIVDTRWPGVTVEHRCRFMGLRALGNAYLSFRDVRIPRDHLIGAEGDGLRVALATLNTGRLTLPAATAGLAKKCVEVVRKWSQARVQWGRPIGQHEAVARMNADIAASAYAMESVALAIGELADQKDYDIRLEAAAAKEWNTVRAWKLVDTTLQVRGGRGYETERSLRARGEPAIGIERALRDCRINTIFEGSSEIMHLFIAREAVDKHLAVAGALVDGQATREAKLQALTGAIGFYAWWYPSRFFGWSSWPRYREFGVLAPHMRFADRASRRLARALFHGMVVYRAGLEKRQSFLFRAVDIATELFVVSVVACRTRAMVERNTATANSAIELADVFMRAARRRIQQTFAALWRNDDARESNVGQALLEERYDWLEDGVIGIPYGVHELVPPGVGDLLALEREQLPNPPSIDVRRRTSENTAAKAGS